MGGGVGQGGLVQKECWRLAPQSQRHKGKRPKPEPKPRPIVILATTPRPDQTPAPNTKNFQTSLHNDTTKNPSRPQPTQKPIPQPKTHPKTQPHCRLGGGEEKAPRRLVEGQGCGVYAYNFSLVIVPPLSAYACPHFAQRQKNAPGRFWLS